MKLQITALNVLAKYYHCILHSGTPSLLLLSTELHHSLNCNGSKICTHNEKRHENGMYMDKEHQFFVA